MALRAQKKWQEFRVSGARLSRAFEARVRKRKEGNWAFGIGGAMRAECFILRVSEAFSYQAPSRSECR